ncbi:ankyrin repeat domain-containing protein [Winogradskyella aurantia]|uniref:Uncharacterized protein n=1 Tax=Winogradskyella aurantia TaxID=1915063 RepID=A0A265UVE7_9FLAO|nr:ankyrin repeat domain-containing protein [Winogradskyella aurantia]OZV69182.1 hypothetical protein CA834_06915 [Winogradskyella aurantia]
MKKTAVILALALGFSIGNLNATNHNFNLSKDAIMVAPVEVSPICKAAATGDLDEVKRLINNGVDVNKKSNGMMPIHYAAKFNRVEIIKVLITAGSDIHKPSDNGYSALTYAERFNAKDAAQFLKRFKQ